MTEIEIHRFHPTQPTVKKTMTQEEFNKMKKQEGYIYRAYQINWNKSII